MKRTSLLLIAFATACAAEARTSTVSRTNGIGLREK